MIRRIPWELAALPLLGISRLLPDTGWGLWLRLAAATACLLLPGALLARALRVPSFSATLAWSLAALFVAMAVVFAVHASLTLALVLLGVIAAAALVWSLLRASNKVLQARPAAPAGSLAHSPQTLRQVTPISLRSWPPPRAS